MLQREEPHFKYNKYVQSGVKVVKTCLELFTVNTRARIFPSGEAKVHS